jgi:antiviral helicase SKI2
VNSPKEEKMYFTSKQEATMWVQFLNHLKKLDKLPVVAFTLSRNRCDHNSENLTSVDLTTTSEKYFILKFFNRSIQNLKQEDRTLPQVNHTLCIFTVMNLHEL